MLWYTMPHLHRDAHTRIFIYTHTHIYIYIHITHVCVCSVCVCVCVWYDARIVCIQIHIYIKPEDFHIFPRSCPTCSKLIDLIPGCSMCRYVQICADGPRWMSWIDDCTKDFFGLHALASNESWIFLNSFMAPSSFSFFWAKHRHLRFNTWRSGGGTRSQIAIHK